MTTGIAPELQGAYLFALLQLHDLVVVWASIIAITVKSCSELGCADAHINV